MGQGSESPEGSLLGEGMYDVYYRVLGTQPKIWHPSASAIAWQINGIKE